jgi:hypothetical protein
MTPRFDDVGQPSSCKPQRIPRDVNVRIAEVTDIERLRRKRHCALVAVEPPAFDERPLEPSMADKGRPRSPLSTRTAFVESRDI